MTLLHHQRIYEGEDQLNPVNDLKPSQRTSYNREPNDHHQSEDGVEHTENITADGKMCST
jgi:hypothetical protein